VAVHERSPNLADPTYKGRRQAARRRSSESACELAKRFGRPIVEGAVRAHAVVVDTPQLNLNASASKRWVVRLRQALVAEATSNPFVIAVTLEA
jgi:hypothetical protein